MLLKKNPKRQMRMKRFIERNITERPVLLLPVSKSYRDGDRTFDHNPEEPFIFYWFIYYSIILLFGRINLFNKYLKSFIVKMNEYHFDWREILEFYFKFGYLKGTDFILYWIGPDFWRKFIRFFLFCFGLWFRSPAIFRSDW